MPAPAPAKPAAGASDKEAKPGAVGSGVGVGKCW